MKKIFSILFLLFVFASVKAQLPSVVEMGQDSIRITRGEFVLRNSTKDIVGMLVNTGGGVTTFVRFEKISDTSLIYGTDTLFFSSNVSVAAGTDTVVNVGGYYEVYKSKSGREFQMRTLFSDTSLVFIQDGDSLKIVVDPGVFSSVQRLIDTAAAIRADFPEGGSSTVTASRGLHVNGSDVRWGVTPLDSAVDIDQDGNGITFHGGLFRHGTGDYLVQTSPFSFIEVNEDHFTSTHGDGSGNFYAQIGTNIDVADPEVNLRAGKQTFVSSEIQVKGTAISLNNSTGNIFIPVLRDSAQSYILNFNPFDGIVTYSATPIGGVGDDLTEITADNGLKRSTISNVQLGNSSAPGAALLHNTFIDATSSYKLTITGANTGSNATLELNNTSSGRAVSINSGLGVAASINSTLGTALEVNSPNLPAILTKSGSATTTYGNPITILHTTSGTAGNGFGASYKINLEYASGSTATAGEFGAKWIDATNRISQADIFAATIGVEGIVASFKGDGQMILPYYVGTTFDGAVVKGLGVDASGNVITFAPSGVSSGDVDAAIAAKVNMDGTYFNGTGPVGDEYTLDISVVALQTDISFLNARIDSALANWPVGGAAGKTWIQNAGGTGDTLSFRVNDSLFSVKRLKPGTNVTFSVDGNSITINGASGSAEVNTLSITLSGTGSLTISVEAILEMVLVNPTTTLANFRIGTVSDDDYYFPGTSVPATALAHEMIVNRYIPSSTAIYFTGVTPSTVIDLIFKPIHR